MCACFNKEGIRAKEEKAVTNKHTTLDFVGFSYKGKHSLRDLNIYRTSDGNRYNNNLMPTITDKSMEIPGNDGMYFFGAYHKQKQFNINIAFDSLTEK